MSVRGGLVLDLAGNANLASDPFSIYVNRTGPIPAVSSPQGARTSASPVTFVVDFGEGVTGFEAGDVALSGTADRGGVRNLAGSGASYSFDVLPASEGTIRVVIPEGAANSTALGNPSSASARYSVIHDTTPPAAAIAPAQPGPPANSRVVSFSVTFDEPINASTFAASDADASSGTARGARLSPQHAGSFGGLGSGAGNLSDPYGAAVDSSGRVYVAESINRRVSVFDSALDYVGSITADHFLGPIGVAVDSSDNVYVADADADRVTVFNSSWHPVANITNVPPNRFLFPAALAVDGSDNVYVADADNDRIQVFDSELRHVANIVGPPGSPLESPRGVAVDASGHVYVAARQSNAVRVFGPSLDYIGDLRPLPEVYRSDVYQARFSAPRDVAVDPATGNIYAVDALDRVLVFNSTRHHVATISDEVDPLGNSPRGVAVDGANGTLYVTDSSDHTVRAFDVNSYAFYVENPDYGETLSVSLPAGRVDDLAGNANAGSNEAGIGVVRGPVPSITTELGNQTGAEKIAFRLEFDRAIDASTLGAPDIEASSGEVRNLHPLFQHVQTFGGHGSSNYQFNRPIGIAVNASGYIYVADR